MHPVFFETSFLKIAPHLFIPWAGMCHNTHVWSSEGKAEELVLSFHRVGSTEWTQVIKLVSKCLLHSASWWRLHYSAASQRRSYESYLPSPQSHTASFPLPPFHLGNLGGIWVWGPACQPDKAYSCLGDKPRGMYGKEFLDGVNWGETIYRNSGAGDTIAWADIVQKTGRVPVCINFLLPDAMMTWLQRSQAPPTWIPVMMA